MGLVAEIAEEKEEGSRRLFPIYFVAIFLPALVLALQGLWWIAHIDPFSLANNEFALSLVWIIFSSLLVIYTAKVLLQKVSPRSNPPKAAPADQNSDRNGSAKKA